MSALQIRTERDANLLTGEECVRIRYRDAGTRQRWTSILVFPDEGQALEEVESLAADIAERHRSGASASRAGRSLPSLSAGTDETERA